MTETNVTGVSDLATSTNQTPQKAPPPKIRINEVRELTDDVSREIDDMFDYHAWSDAQKDAGAEVRSALAAAVKAIVKNVPPSPDRTVAIRKIREARMDANSAITHGGKY